METIDIKNVFSVSADGNQPEIVDEGYTATLPLGTRLGGQGAYTDMALEERRHVILM